MSGTLLWHLVLCLLFLLSSSSQSGKLCSSDDSFALLHFKNSISIDSTASSRFDCHAGVSNPRTNSWKQGTDCCSWDGVTCDRFTGHVTALDLSSSWLISTIEVNSSLFLLQHLRKLNLACNDFQGSEISSHFGQFTYLTHLNLSRSFFAGQVPIEISHLSKLISLDLSTSRGLVYSALIPARTVVMKGLVQNMSGLVQNMSGLEELKLDYVDMSGILHGCLTNLSSSLRLLSLRGCELYGSFPENIFHLPYLHTLDIGLNRLVTVTLPEFNRSISLRYLDISFTRFSGKLPHSIGNLKFLIYLDIKFCSCSGLIPTSMGNLTQLSYLSLDRNEFFGKIPSFLSKLEKLVSLQLSKNNFDGKIPDIFVNLTQISYLDLSSNSLDGALPSSLFALPSLVFMDLSNNKLTGRIPEFRKNSLQTIDLSSNSLYGSIPNSIFELEDLTDLRLESNNLSGTIELYMFAKLKNLDKLDLSYNSISLSPTTTIKINSSFSQLSYLKSLDLSNNKIHGNIPNWLFNFSYLEYLNLSHNFMRGIERIPWTNLQVLDLCSNLLQGLLPAPPPSLMVFLASDNKLTGMMMPSSFCNLSRIAYLDLSNNGLYGRIPQCLGNLTTTLRVLDFKRNNFHGSIPQTFVKGSPLATLNLNGNQLEGPLPRSFVNCAHLGVLDLGNNIINDVFPHWIADLPQLQVLVLRSNRFHGPLGDSKTRLPFSKLRILDISHNKFNGHLQAMFFINCKAMMSGKSNSSERIYMGNIYYEDSVMMTIKGVDIQMQKILTVFTTMDLSSNNFEGQLPDVVGKLNSLIILNFSHNNLMGHIPISLENLTELESLDLSLNMLKGNIPMQLTSLTFLSVLNLSYNQLVGPIPSGKQFDTFENNSYIGNLELCGKPLSKKCSNDEAPESEPPKFQEEVDTSSWFDWKVIMMGYGSGVVIGLSMGYMVFSTGKPWWFVSIIERKVLNLTGRRRRRRN